MGRRKTVMVGGVVLLLGLGVGTWLWLQRDTARPVTLEEASERRTATTAGDATAGTTPEGPVRPAAGVYDYAGSGSESLSLPPLSQKQGHRLDGSLFFGAAQRFLTELTEVSDVRVVILRFADLQVLDATGAHALQETIAELEGRGITVLLKGLRPDHLRTLEAVGAIDRLRTERHVFTTLDDAVAHARTHLAPAA